MGDAGASDREGSTADGRRLDDAPGAGCSSVPVAVKRVFITGTNPIKSRWLPGRKHRAREVAVCVNGGSGPRPAV
jgi:hypothetical protein